MNSRGRNAGADLPGAAGFAGLSQLWSSNASPDNVIARTSRCSFSSNDCDEAIQSCFVMKKDWIASSILFLEGEKQYLHAMTTRRSMGQLADGNDGLNVIAKPFMQ